MTIDEAWRAVEAALPEGWTFWGLAYGRGTWSGSAGPTDGWLGEEVESIGKTPVEALTSLVKQIHRYGPSL